MAANLSDKSGSAGDAARRQLNKTLSDLAPMAQDLGLQLPDLNEAITALANSQFDQVLKDLQAAQIDLEKLQAMAQALKQLQQQAAQTGRTCRSNSHNGEAEAAAATLRKMAEQLKSANLSSQDLQKILDEVGGPSTRPARTAKSPTTSKTPPGKCGRATSPAPRTRSQRPPRS